MVLDFSSVAPRTECAEKSTSATEVMEGRGWAMGCSAIGWVNGWMGVWMARWTTLKSRLDNIMFTHCLCAINLKHISQRNIRTR